MSPSWRAAAIAADARCAEDLARRLAAAGVSVCSTPETGDLLAGAEPDTLLVVPIDDLPRLLGPTRPETPAPGPLVAVFEGGLTAERWASAGRYRVRWLSHLDLLQERWVIEPLAQCALRWSDRVALGDDPAAGRTVRRTVGSEEGRARVVVEAVKALEALRRPPRPVAACRLLLEEALTNAIVHGLRPGERTESPAVEVRLRVAEDRFAFSVVDRAGSLTEARFRAAVAHQLSGRGLLDEGGRGLSLLLSLSNLVAVNVDPGVSTEVVVVAAGGHPPGRVATALNVVAGDSGAVP